MFPNIEILKNIKTPYYYYDMALLESTLQIIRQESTKHNFNIHYAIKANTDSRILSKIKSYGMGADCVSGNEIRKSLDYGFQANKIVYAGVGKSDEEINFALDNDIFSFNCESLPEIEVINELAAAKNKIANIALRINPNIDAKTHKYITTGIEENKFGINSWEFEEGIDLISKSNNIKLIGLHFHIGSQITDLNIFKSLCTRINDLQDWFNLHNISLEHINVGGGLGIDYHNPDTKNTANFKEYFQIFKQYLQIRNNQQIHFELGRSVVAQCGSLISKVLYIKKGIKTNFAILDAGMTELLRPALYQAFHHIENISSTEKEETYDVVGPICESSDCFGKKIKLATTKRNDYIAIRSTGAYGQVMASNYNLRNIAQSIFSDEL